MKKIVSIFLLIAMISLTLSSCHAHEYGEWVTVKEAGCTENGINERVCTCGKKESKKISATGHNYIEGICNKCDDVIAEPTSDEYFIFTELDNGSYSIAAKDIENLPKTVILPSSYNGKPVTVIAEHGFAAKVVDEEVEYNGRIYVVGKMISPDISTMVIPDSIKTIDNYAFSHCSELDKVIMGNSVTHIGNRAFECCKLKTIDLSDSLTYIGEYAFMSNIEFLVLPDSVTTIGASAFDNSNLISITIPESVTEIGRGALGYCSLLCEIVNNSSVEIDKISPNVLEVHKGKSKLIEQNGYLFYPYEEKIFLVRYVGDESNLLLPSTIKGKSYDIRVLAFAFCEAKSIVIPEGVKEIGSSAFYYCKSLEKVYIPKSITLIHVNDINLFQFCGKMKDVYYAGSKDDGSAIEVVTSKELQDKTYCFEDLIIDGVTLHYNFKYSK